MPLSEPVALNLQSYRIRLVAPASTLYPSVPSTNIMGGLFTILNRDDMVARPIPEANIPTSNDFATGQWTGRLSDAGDGSLTFPNKDSSVGRPWRNLFDPTNKLQWYEIYVNEFLEAVHCITKVVSDRNQIVVTGYDGFQMCKSAYVRDWTVTQAPRDVIERGTQLWTPIIVDAFPYLGTPVPSPQWSTSTIISSAKSGGTGANDTSNGGAAWTSPSGFVSGSGASFTSASGMAPGTQTQAAWLQGTNFGFAIPGTATVVGIAATVTTTFTPPSGASYELTSNEPVLVIGGVTQTARFPNVGAPAFSSTFLTPTTVSEGNSSDLWHGTAPTVAQVNASGFGLAITGEVASYAAGTTTIAASAVTMTVFYTTPGSAAVQIQTAGGCSMSVTSTSGNTAQITSGPLFGCTSTWAITATFSFVPGASSDQLCLQIFEDTTWYQLNFSNLTTVYLQTNLNGANSNIAAQITPPTSTTYTFTMESDGEWISGFFNGQLVGFFRRPTTIPNSVVVNARLVSLGTATSTILSNIVMETLSPFLQRSSATRISPEGVASAASQTASGGTDAWVNPTNITVPGQFTSWVSTTAPATSQLISATGFGFNIPSNATITGVQVTLSAGFAIVGGAIVTENVIQLVTAPGTVTGSNKSGGTWPAGTFYTPLVFGGVRDLWGATLTPAVVNASGFGVAWQLHDTSGSLAGEAQVEYPVVIDVFYTLSGSDSGDYVLPGSSSTYPFSGLHARYFNDLDLQSDSFRLYKIMAPSRTQAYAGSGSPEYVNQQDPGLIGQSNPVPGATTNNWSARWFGAIYLKLSTGDYSLQLSIDADCAARVWIGKTRFGDQLVDQWNWSLSSMDYLFTVSASTLSGTASDGTIVARDGWYPIIIEMAADGTLSTAPGMYFTNVPATYTDPGGTSIIGGVHGPPTLVPSTSLSPLGCIDNRYQGSSHFDLVQKTAQATGYQFTVKPQQLESGFFPGVLAPRIREGQDYDAVIEPDDTPHREGMINYSNTLDGTDQASSVSGNGAGFQNGTTGQLQAYVQDPSTLTNALFDMQAWQDNADASYSTLLQALLNSELANRLTPWQVVAGDPLARDRQAYTWPISGKVANMRWKPGDGALVRAFDIALYDTTPRQLLLITRNILSAGISSTTVGWAGRPKSPAYANRKLLSSAIRPQRNYQKQLVTLNGAYITDAIAAGVGTVNDYGGVVVNPGDQIVSAQLRVAFVIGASATLWGVAQFDGVSWVDQSAALGGPWVGDTTAHRGPFNINVMPILKIGTQNRLLITVNNQSASVAITQSDFQLFVNVLR